MKSTNVENFASDVLEKDFVVVDFYADWCGPCRVIIPTLEEIQEEIGVEIVKVNIDECPDIASQYGVMSIPTLLIFKSGVKIDANVGAASKARIIDWIGKYR
jgi:thioredoxin 1